MKVGWRTAARALLAVLFITNAGLAEGSPRERARSVFRAGTQAYRASEYLAAARAFEDSYAHLPLAASTFSAAQAYRRQYFVDQNVEWLRRAQQLYRRYLREQPSGGRREHALTHLEHIEILLSTVRTDPEPPAPEPATELLVSSSTEGAEARVDGGGAARVPVVTSLKPGRHTVLLTAPGHFPSEFPIVAVQGKLTVLAIELKPEPARLRVDTEPGAEVWLDGRLAGVAPLAREVVVEAGLHELAVVRSGRRPYTRSLRLERGARTTLRVALSTTDQRYASLASFGGASAFALGSGVNALLALNAESDAEAARRQRMTPNERDAYNDAVDRRNTHRGVAVALGGISALMAGAGLVLFAFDPATPPSAAPARRSAALGKREWATH